MEVAPIIIRMDSKESLKGTSSRTKRVNSKDDFVVEGSVLKRMNSKEELLRTKTMSADLLQLEDAVFYCSKQHLQKAMKIAKKSHCDEGLLFLQIYKEWKAAKTLKGKSKVFRRMRKQFFAKRSSHEVFLPEELRDSLMTREETEDIDEAKRCVLNDIRFNQVILSALIA